MNHDLVTLVTEQDEVIGQMDKVEAHRSEGRLHRAISVFLFREVAAERKLLLQQRSETKIVGASQWANTCCGNVRPTETYAECARRRLREELGISGVSLVPVDTFLYAVQCNEEFSERELDQIYVGWYDGSVTPNPEEVQATQWTSWTALTSLLIKNGVSSEPPLAESELAPWLKLMLQDKKLVKKIETSTQETYGA